LAKRLGEGSGAGKLLKKGVCSDGECGGLWLWALCEDDTDGEQDSAGELSVDGDSEEQGDELMGDETVGRPPRWKRLSDESGRTRGRGLGLAFGRVRRLLAITISMLDVDVEDS